MEVTTHFADGTAFKLLENALLAFVLAGVLWNVSAGYELVTRKVVPAGIALTTVPVFALVSLETMTDTTRRPKRL